MVGLVCRGKGGEVVFDGRVSEDLTSAWRVQDIHFVGCTSQGADFTGAPKAPE